MADPFKISPEEPVGKDASLLGAYVPRQLVDYIHLLALYYNTTSSDVIRTTIRERLENEEPEDSIVRILASRAYREWQRRLDERRKQPGWQSQDNLRKRFSEYEQEMKQTLLKRKITLPKIMEVLEQMENTYGV